MLIDNTGLVCLLTLNFRYENEKFIKEFEEQILNNEYRDNKDTIIVYSVDSVGFKYKKIYSKNSKYCGNCINGDIHIAFIIENEDSISIFKTVLLNDLIDNFRVQQQSLRAAEKVLLTQL